MMTNHALDEVLEEYALNRLSPDQNAELEEHLLVCHACQDRL
ncbi:MAG: zf-HC2 domain-containing protein, partial [Bryobacterales bacterium]|nr:zf-HC2 domain-containing protein [Bryobacterales bacterium]